jgi:hypothetical protein
LSSGDGYDLPSDFFERPEPRWRGILSFDGLMTRLSGRSRQLLVLTRHFFNRLFQNEVFPFEEQMKEKLIASLVLLSVLGGHIAVSLFGKYGMLEKYIFLTEDPGSWVDKCYFIAFFMTVLAFIVVLDWDFMFLDRKDAFNLLPLPVRARTLFQAKFLSFIVLILLFTAAVNALSVAVVSFFLPHLRFQHLGFLFQYAGAHLLSTTTAFAFTFFLFALLNAVFLIVLSPRLYRRVTLILRFGLMVGLVILLTMFLVSSLFMPNMFAWMGHVLEGESGAGLLFPPFWFTGLYEWLLGNRDPVFGFGASVALASLLVLLPLYFGAIAISYRRHLRRSTEEVARRDPLRNLKNTLSRAFQSVALRNSTQRAVYYFVIRTLRTSAMHRIRIAGSLALGIGLSLIFLFNSGVSFQSLSAQNLNILAVPLVLSFFLLVSLRMTSSTPLAPQANWIFKMTEVESRRHYFVGMKKALVIRALVPLFLLLLFAYADAWGWKKAALHTAYGFASALILLEVLFWKYSKIPFSCVSMPGQAKVHVYWVFYGLGFLFYTRGLSLLERGQFWIRGHFIPYFGIVATLLVFLWRYQDVFIYRRLRIVYEDEPEEPLISLR